MMPYTPSYAIDALSSGNAPGVTIYPKLATGSPETILKHVTDMLQKAQQFTQLIEEFKKAEKQLSDAWSGQAADSAVKKIENSLQAFNQIVQVIQRGATLLESSATMITTAQTGYTSVVSAVNPTVAGLMSNPWTYGAAQALATVTAASLSAFVNAISGLLKALGAVKIAGELATLAQIITLLEQLFNNKQTTPVSSGAVTGSTVTAPTTPVSAASVTGQQTITAAGQQSAAATQQAALQTAQQSGAQTGQTLSGLESTLQQNGQMLHTSSGQLYTADGQPLYNAAGQPAFQNYAPAALSGLPTGALSGLAGLNGTAGLSTAGAGGTDLTGTLAGQPTDSWNAVDPSQTAAGGVAHPGTDPGAAAGTTDSGNLGEEIRVTTTHGDTTTTVEVPIDGHNEVTVDSAGTVTVDSDAGSYIA